MIDALPNDTQVMWLLLLFCKKNPDENTPLNQVFTSEFSNADIARQPFHLYSSDLLHSALKLMTEYCKQ